MKTLTLTALASLFALLPAACVGSDEIGLDSDETADSSDSALADAWACTKAEAAQYVHARQLLVAIEGGGAVVLDPASGATLHTYDTGNNAFGAVYTPDGKRAFVTDKDAGTLVEIDPNSSAIVRTIQVGTTPQQPVITSDDWLFIPLSGAEGIAVIDIIDGGAEPAGIMPTGAGTKPHILALSPDQETLWATIQGKDPKVMSFDLASDAPAKHYRYDIVPRVLAATDAGAWFTGHHSTGLHLAKLADGTSSTPYMDVFGSASEARKQIEGVSVVPDGSVVALTHEGRKALVVLGVDAEGKTHKLLDVDTLANKPYWTTLDPSGRLAYVSIPDSGTVQAYCGKKAFWTAPVGGKPKRMAVTE